MLRFMNKDLNWSPTRAAALARLQDFAPGSGRKYAAERNTDNGPGQRDNVSLLSPWIRHRVITEREVLAATLNHFAPGTAEKFIQEVCWRTYWKGWLEMRPAVWQRFAAERDRQRQRLGQNTGLATAVQRAEEGRAGIEGFDDWARELVETGYLHNHARMWFASIWIFTLGLPWSLGADFFLRHLLDADPASNTLGWRWVAGLQTPGKTYLARPDNIEKFTNGRFRPDQLATEAPAIDEPEPPPKPASPPPAADPEAIAENVLLLVHGEDLHPQSLGLAAGRVRTALVSASGHADHSWPFGDKAGAFVRGAADDCARRLGEWLDRDVPVHEGLDSAPVIDAARAAGVSTVVTPYAPVGPVADGLVRLEADLAETGLVLRRLRRGWDERAWPHATRGFFAFKKHIPDLMVEAGLVEAGLAEP